MTDGEMDMNAYASIAVLQLPTQSRLLKSACCPDKDLVVLLSRLGGKDKLSLWKMQGSKKWEIDVSVSETDTEDIVGLAWSPDGQSIALAHDPPRITLHSIQDGHEERVLPVVMPSNTSRRSFRITGIWWYQDEQKVDPSSIPDMFKRNGIVTGTAHSILKTLPLLDHLHDDSQKLTATDLFAFQGSQTRVAPKASLPDLIKSWPALLPDLQAASIATALQLDQHDASRPFETGLHDANFNSILAIADDLGHVHCFLEGTYPLGAVRVSPETLTPSLFKDPKLPEFFAHPQKTPDNEITATLQPVAVGFPLLKTRMPRDLAKLSSTTRELVWYVTRVVKEMRGVWFGSETSNGAREIGPKWIRALEARQKEQFGQEEPSSILDLTSLLVTGRVSESLADFLGSGDQMSDRGIQKWDSTVTEALIKLRDFSEKRVAPACQRIVLVLQEVLGWAQLPQLDSFELQKGEIEACLDLAGRAIVISGWLAAVARRELARFKEFIAFIRHETVAVESRPAPEFDMLEANQYMVSGLVVSSIDKWFMGPIPRFSSEDLGVPSDKHDLQQALKKARVAATNPSQTAWQSNIKQKDLSHIDRNIDALVQELTARCQRVFVRAAGASARSAIVTFGPGPESLMQVASPPVSEYSTGALVRERVLNASESGKFLHCLVSHVTAANQEFLCVSRTRYDAVGEPAPEIAWVDCKVATDDGLARICIQDADFFDDDNLIVLYNVQGQDSGVYIAMFNYADLRYQELRFGGSAKCPSREDLIFRVLSLWQEGHITLTTIPITACRELMLGHSNDVSIAVNGRVGRRVACVLDNKSWTMEVLDMEGSPDTDSTGEDAGETEVDEER